MNLWREIFSPKPLPMTSPSGEEWNLAWNWLFEDKTNAALKLTIARNHSLSLRRIGVKESSKMAVVGLWKRYASNHAPAIKVPQRRF